MNDEQILMLKGYNIKVTDNNDGTKYFSLINESKKNKYVHAVYSNRDDKIIPAYNKAVNGITNISEMTKCLNETHEVEEIMRYYEMYKLNTTDKHM